MFSVTHGSGGYPAVLDISVLKSSSLTFFLHASFEAFPQSAVSALVPLVLVYHAVPVEPAEWGKFERYPKTITPKLCPHSSSTERSAVNCP